jgi:3-deoxy-D-manno-octulosonic-acid transferase
MMLSLYNLTATLASPLIWLYLKRRKAQGKEDALRFPERQGIANIPRPDGPLIWLHGASVGEAISLLPLIERLQQAQPGATILMTTGTVTSARLMAERMPAGTIHQFVPVDRLPYVRRFLDHWRPNLVLWAESEFWPNLVREPARRGIPMVLVNGRISENSFKGWQRFSGTMATLLSGFSLCLGQTDTDVERLTALGAPVTKCRGNLKFAVPPLPVKKADLAALKKELGDRPLWLAASTHQGEELIVSKVHTQVAKHHPGLLSIIVPRHATRGQEIAQTLSTSELRIARRSQSDAVTAETDIYIADTMGELGLFFRLAKVAFIGKSLVPLGGQNPLEAMRLDCAVAHGPHMTNFADIVQRMSSAGASIEVSDEAALAKTVGRLLTNEDEIKNLAATAKSFAEAEEHVLDDVMTELKPFLANLSDKDKSDASA